MKFLKSVTFLVFLFFSIHIISAQETISSGRISITFINSGNGVQISNIKDNGQELLNTITTNPAIFTLNIHNSNTNTDETIDALSNWGNVNITNSEIDVTIVLSNPTNTNLPNSLEVTMTISTDDKKSSWDLSVSGLGNNCSLLDTVFPQLNIKADGNDTFFYPLYSGQLTNNPGEEIDYFDDGDDIHDNTVGVYPRGWGTTMQFFSYYNVNYGMYFGFHDEKASLKNFGIKNENGGVRIQCTIPAENKTINGNDWEMPGYFELDLFDGDWYDTSLIYKEWVSTSANYWPQDSAEHIARQHIVGELGAWITTHMAIDGTIAENQTWIQMALNFYDFPVGVHLYDWNNFEHDHFYPTFFPEQDNFDTLIATIQNNNDAVIMPYINGRMWDTGVGGNDIGDEAAVTYFNTTGILDATKHSDGTFYEDFYEGNTFATMCPTQTNWQSIIIDAADQITNENRLGAKSVYLDMISASPPIQCMDESHNHTLGGGSFWRDGYKQMLQNIHTTLPSDTFITVEGGCDYLADEVDAFMVQGWQTKNQVPAWQVIYTGKVQLFGTETNGGMYGDQHFYGRLSQGFSYGVQTGRQFIWLAINPTQNPQKEMAANYVRTLGRMRYKLRNFMSYGEMKRPINITGAIPEITYEVKDWGGSQGIISITNPAIRKTVWQNNNEVVVLFVNGRIQSPAGVSGGNIDFNFDFDPSNYGLIGNLTIQELTPTTDGAIQDINASTFPKNVSLQNLDVIAYKITADGVTGQGSTNRSSISVYPNPVSNILTINYIDEIETITIVNSLGQRVLEITPTNKKIDISSLPRGFYFVTIKVKNKKITKKIIKN